MRNPQLNRSTFVVLWAIFLIFSSPTYGQKKVDTKKKTTKKTIKKNSIKEIKSKDNIDKKPKSSNSTSTKAKITKIKTEPIVSQDKHLFRLIKIEEKTNSLKEKIFRSKAQLMLLQESLLHGVISTAKIILGYENKMGSAFYLKEAQYSLDGTPLYSKIDYNGNLQNQKKLIIYQGSIQPSQHTLSVKLIYQGNGFGAFSYLSKYKFVIKSSYTFRAEEKKKIEIKVVAYEKNWLTTPLKERPSVRYDVTLHNLTAHRKKLVMGSKK